MRILLTTDTHFGHRSLVEKYKSRPADFETKILQNWRNMVGKDDLIIHLGDLFVGKSTNWTSITPTLPGRKILVMGNHDKKSQSWYMANGFDFCCHEFSWEIFGMNILFSHEPQSIGNFDMNIHGHLHMGRHREYEYDNRHYLLALEHTNYQPQTLKSIVEKWKQSK